eukprot:s1405_g5.t1
MPQFLQRVVAYIEERTTVTIEDVQTVEEDAPPAKKQKTETVPEILKPTAKAKAGLRMSGTVKRHMLNGRFSVFCQEISGVHGRDAEIPPEHVPMNLKVGDHVSFIVRDLEDQQSSMPIWAKNVQVLSSAPVRAPALRAPALRAPAKMADAKAVVDLTEEDAVEVIDEAKAAPAKAANGGSSPSQRKEAPVEAKAAAVKAAKGGSSPTQEKEAPLQAAADVESSCFRSGYQPHLSSGPLLSPNSSLEVTSCGPTGSAFDRSPQGRSTSTTWSQAFRLTKNLAWSEKEVLTPWTVRFDHPLSPQISVDAAEAPEDEEEVLPDASEAEKKAEEEGNDPDAYAAAVKESADAVQDIELTDRDKKDKESIAKLKEYQDMVKNDPEAALDKYGGNFVEEWVEERSVKDPVFAKFTRFHALNKNHVLRYHLGGAARWFCQFRQLEDVPKCPHCGGPRVFECQVQPMLIAQLKGPLQERLDFGTICIYSCEESCDPHVPSYLEEFAYVQPEPVAEWIPHSEKPPELNLSPFINPWQRHGAGVPVARGTGIAGGFGELGEL